MPAPPEPAATRSEERRALAAIVVAVGVSLASLVVHAPSHWVTLSIGVVILGAEAMDGAAAEATGALHVRLLADAEESSPRPAAELCPRGSPPSIAHIAPPSAGARA